jgi:hypothetical protein
VYYDQETAASNGGGHYVAEKKAYRMERYHPRDLFDLVAEKTLMDHAYKMGYEAFMAYRPHCENPFNPHDWQRSNAWDQGWAAAENANPGRYDFSTDRFIFDLSFIQGNPDCPF